MNPSFRDHYGTHLFAHLGLSLRGRWVEDGVSDTNVTPVILFNTKLFHFSTFYKSRTKVEEHMRLKISVADMIFPNNENMKPAFNE